MNWQMSFLEQYCIDNNILPPEDFPWLRYGIEKRLLSIAGIVISVTLASALSDPYTAISFCGSFYYLRSRTNGYHAKTVRSCLGSADKQICNAGAVDHPAEGNGQRMGNGQTRGGILVGDLTAVVNTGLTCHHIGLDGEDVALCTAECVVARRCNGGCGTAHIPLDRGNRCGGDLVGSGTNDIHAGGQNQVGRTPIRGVCAVVRVIHLGLGKARPNIACQRKGVIVVNDCKPLLFSSFMLLLSLGCWRFPV